MLLAILVGAWLGHALEYVRVWGTRGFGGLVSRSLHAYMGPVGVVLLLAGVVAAASSSLVAAELERGLEQLRRGMRTGLGAGGRAEAGIGVAAVRRPAIVGFSTLVAVLWLSQLPIYLIQENVEAKVAHIPTPGMGTLSGRHVLAPVVHLGVAVAVACVLYLTRRRVTQLADEVRRTGARLAALRRSAPAAPAPRPRDRWWTPAELWGRQSWSRPPPALA